MLIHQCQSFAADGFEILGDDNGRFLQFKDSSRLEDLDDEFGMTQRDDSLKVYLFDHRKD